MILFGCWNQGTCNANTDIPKNGMSAVMKQLKSKTAQRPPDFIVVLGDNYYPKKDETKKKIFNKDELQSGFDCLKELKTTPIDGKPGINLLMGNHDLQEETGIVTRNGHIQDECIITQTEMEMVNKDKDDKKIDIKSYGRIFGDHTICLFICSTLYTDKASEIVKCMGMNIYRPHYDAKKDIEYIIQREYDNITTELNRLLKLLPEPKTLIICGHEPIVSRRYKPSKNVNTPSKNVKTSLNDDGIRLLKDLYTRVGNVNKYYICADVHQYQEGIVEIMEPGMEPGMEPVIQHTINQYVVGVGGTECDEECISKQKDVDVKIDDSIYIGLRAPEEIVPGKIKYTMKVCERKFGYLSCKDNIGNLTCEFVSVAECGDFPVQEVSNVQKGGKKKRKTIKKKRRIRKNNISKKY